MPTVIRLDGLRVVIYPNDHRPAHVHVIGAGKEAVYNLNCPEGPLELRASFGFGRREVNGIGELLGEELAMLCDEWTKIHGDF